MSIYFILCFSYWFVSSISPTSFLSIISPGPAFWVASTTRIYPRLRRRRSSRGSWGWCGTGGQVALAEVNRALGGSAFPWRGVWPILGSIAASLLLLLVLYARWVLGARPDPELDVDPSVVIKRADAHPERWFLGEWQPWRSVRQRDPRTTRLAEGWS